MLTKQQFIKKYNTLTPEQKQEAKQYHEDIYKSAIFPQTLATAEKCLLWIREAEVLQNEKN